MFPSNQLPGSPRTVRHHSGTPQVHVGDRDVLFNENAGDGADSQPYNVLFNVNRAVDVRLKPQTAIQHTHTRTNARTRARAHTHTYAHTHTHTA